MTASPSCSSIVDTLIVIPNQNLFRLANERTGWKEAFKMADNVLYMGVRGVTDLMVAPGLVNLDFADIRTVMAEMGKAMMGTGEADGENRAIRAAEAAISNPLLEDTSMAGARGLLINITGGDDMTLFEVDQAANRIREEVDEEANIIFGSAIDETLTGKIRVSVVATGIDTPSQRTGERPKLVAVGGGAQPAVSTAAGRERRAARHHDGAAGEHEPASAPGRRRRGCTASRAVARRPVPGAAAGRAAHDAGRDGAAGGAGFGAWRAGGAARPAILWLRRGRRPNRMRRRCTGARGRLWRGRRSRRGGGGGAAAAAAQPVRHRDAAPSAAPCRRLSTRRRRCRRPGRADAA